MRVASSNITHLSESAYLRERELLRDYPELESLVDAKIHEWLRIKGKLLSKNILPILIQIELLEDPFVRWYWKQALKCMLPKRYIQAVNNLARLKQTKRDVALSKAQSSRNNSIEDFLKRKAYAKSIPISSVYSFQNLNKKGDKFYALCPLHNEQSSSFVIYPDNSFHCFGCNAHGKDSIDFIRLIFNCDFKEAVARLVGAV